MSCMAMENSEISCSPVLSDADFSEETTSFHNNDKNLCKYPEHSHMYSMLGTMQPVLSGGSNSDKLVTYTGQFPDIDISSLQSSPRTMHPDSERVEYNSLREMSSNNDVNKSVDSMKSLSKITNLKNSLSDSDICTSTTKTTKLSALWRKPSCMVDSYMFEAALDETSFDNTINKSNSKFTFRRKRRLETNDNSFSEAFNNQAISDTSETNESVEDTDRVSGKLLGNTLPQHSLIEHNVKTRHFKRCKQSKDSDRRFSEAFNNTEIADNDVSQDIYKNVVESREPSQIEKQLKNCGNFCRDIRNKQMVTSSIFQDVFNETGTLNEVVVPDDFVMSSNLNHKDGNSLPDVSNGQKKTQISEHLEYNNGNILHKKGEVEEILDSLHTINIQNELSNVEGNKIFGDVVIRDLSSQSQHNVECECSNSTSEKTKLKERSTSKVEENKLDNYIRTKENEYNEMLHQMIQNYKTSDDSLTKVDNELLKATETHSPLPNSTEDNDISQQKQIMFIHENTVAMVQNESSSKEKKQNEVNSVENVGKTNKVLDIYENMKESCSTLQNIVSNEIDCVNKVYHKNCSEDDRTNLCDSELILDTNENMLSHNTSLETELKHSSSKDSFNLEVEENVVLANKSCVCTSPNKGNISVSDNSAVHKLNCTKTKRRSNLKESSKHMESDIYQHIEGSMQNKEDNSTFTDQNTQKSKEKPNIKNMFLISDTGNVCSTLSNIQNRESITVSDNNSLVNFQSLVYEESDGKMHEEINNGQSALLEFHASKNLNFYSSTRSSLSFRNSSQQNRDLSEVHSNITRTQITSENDTVLNSLNNSLISTTDEDGIENNAEDIFEDTEKYTLNDSLDTTLTESGDPDHYTHDSNFLDTSKNICKKSTDKCNNMKQTCNKRNVTEESFSGILSGDTINKSKKCQKKISSALQEQTSKSLIEKISSNNASALYHVSHVLSCTNDSTKKQNKLENREKNETNKSRTLSNQSKKLKSKSSKNAETGKSNKSSQESMVSDQSTNMNHLKSDVLHDTVTSVNRSLSACKSKTQSHLKISNTSNQSRISRQKLKTTQSQKLVGSTDENNFSDTTGRSRNYFSGSLDHSDEKILGKKSKTEKALTVLQNSNRNVEVITNSTINMEINKTLQHDESNDDNGYDVGCNTFSSTNVDYTPSNEAVVNKKNSKKKIDALRKCLFNSSILQNEDVRKFCIPLSELHTRNKKLLNNENTFVNENSFIDNKFSDGLNVIKKSINGQYSKYGNWATKATKDYLTAKLKPRYGVKASWRCEKLVDFMTKKVNEAIRSNKNYNVPVDEIKLELARLNIIETNLDFYMFVLKYLRQYEPGFVFKSVPCVQTFGRSNLVPRPPNSYLREKIL